MSERLFDRAMFIITCVCAFSVMYIFIVKYDESLVLDKVTHTAALLADRDMAIENAINQATR